MEKQYIFHNILIIIIKNSNNTERFYFSKNNALKELALFSLLRYTRHLNGMWLSLARAQRSGR